jgi:hypothetical protein
MDFYIAAADTDALIGAGGLYDLEIYFLNSDTVRLCYGVVMFSEQITR